MAIWAILIQAAPPVSAGLPFESYFGPTTTVGRLARKIDHLQKHIDECGTVVAKAPDVWGESRLLRHRQDVEDQLNKQLPLFDLRLQAVESTRDSAFLSTVLALRGASPMTVGSTTTAADGSKTTNLVPMQYVDASSVTVTDSSGKSTTTAGPPTLIPSDQELSANDNRLVPRLGFGAVKDGLFQSTFAPGLRSADPSAPKSLQVSIEPTLQLDQLQRYLNHLNELRRINEGDDTTDSPGYSLNLVRIPVSILPGCKTREGHGAEMSVTVRPHLGDDLLPNAFRDLVINDSVNRIGWPVFSIANQEPIRAIRTSLADMYTGLLNKERREACLKSRQIQTPGIPGSGVYVPEPPTSSGDAFFNSYGPALETWQHQFESFASPMAAADDGPKASGGAAPSSDPGSKKVEAFQLSGIRVSAANHGHLRLSIPASQQVEVNGSTLYRVALDAFDRLAEPDEYRAVDKRDDTPPFRRNLSYPAVRSFLMSELRASYEFLSQPATQCLWSHCTPELAHAVREYRGRPIPQVYDYVVNDAVGSTTIQDPGRQRLFQLRKAYYQDLRRVAPDAMDSTTANLSWHLIVDSALLNERLVQDMRDLATSKNCVCLALDWQPYFGPNPPMGAREAFKQYVSCRWPIHVFALDPATQDQNIASQFQQRREFQLVLAAAIANRRLSVQSLTRFIRRMEYDLETIDLNRTDVGFTHGDDTFGWRFYPRVQAPAVPGNLEAMARDLLIGSRDRDTDLRTRRLEPGIRECLAIVVMPSFVPYVTVDFRSNWFRLADNCFGMHALKRRLDLTDAVDLSRDIVDLHELAGACQHDAHRYRDGEVHRLLRAVDQLDRQLPLQTSYVQVPYENSLGGFEMFNNGVTDLQPELHGWYGAPGVNVAEAASGYTDAALAVQVADSAVAVTTAELAEARLRGDAAAIALLLTRLAALETEAAKAKVAFTNISTLAGPPTTIYLVGKNFNLLNTSVLAGGQAIPRDFCRVISRELVAVVIPPSAGVVSAMGQPYVDVHVATPYGASSHLHVNVAAPSPIQTAAAAISAEKTAITKAAVEAAVQATGTPQFSWATDDVEGCVAFACNKVINRLELGTPELKIVQNHAFSDLPGEPCPQFAAFVEVNDGQPAKWRTLNSDANHKLALGPIALTRTPRGTYALDQSDLACRLLSALQQAGLSEARALSAIRLTGFIRRTCELSGAVEVLPLPPLTFKLSACKECCVGQPPCPSPFDLLPCPATPPLPKLSQSESNQPPHSPQAVPRLQGSSSAKPLPAARAKDADRWLPPDPISDVSGVVNLPWTPTSAGLPAPPLR